MAKIYYLNRSKNSTKLPPNFYPLNYSISIYNFKGSYIKINKKQSLGEICTNLVHDCAIQRVDLEIKNKSNKKETCW